MRSALIALLLIVNLLTCPLRCTSCAANVSVSEQSAPAICRCCSDAECAADPEAPVPCSDDCGCENCICEGAVLEADVELSSPMEYSVGEPPLHCVAATFCRRQANLLDHPASSARPFLSGRELRVSHQSWLL
ncbi:hypothetical protein [Allorhodopirellula heiligendammensis]|uniref:hypothetical protein n=1 Tax=Allorhodopirellula heiligendammensis TaxID=2714739 RepID=UPI00265FAB43|nr:hypothetical protein [Allorhodopirellula heiligendammensis]